MLLDVNGDVRLHLRMHDNILLINGISYAVDNVAKTFLRVCNEIGGEKIVLDDKTIDDIVGKLEYEYSGNLRDDLISFFERVYDAYYQNHSQLTNKKVDYRNGLSPVMMVLSLTYRCNNNCVFCYAGGSRCTNELTTEQWKRILDKLWEIGIPIINFSGGEPSLREDLTELVNYSNKFITGLISNGTLLSKSLCYSLKQAKIGHVQVSIESYDAIAHDSMTRVKGSWRKTVEGIENAVASGLNVHTNTTLMTGNCDPVGMVLFLNDLGVRKIAFNSVFSTDYILKGKEKGIDGDDEGKKLTDKMRESLIIADELKMKIDWLSPPCYNLFNPFKLGLGMNKCSAAKYDMSINPSGIVIPCQTWINGNCGNILTDKWEDIWNSKDAMNARKPHQKEECVGCSWEIMCEGSCPLGCGVRER